MAREAKPRPVVCDTEWCTKRGTDHAGFCEAPESWKRQPH